MSTIRPTAVMSMGLMIHYLLSLVCYWSTREYPRGSNSPRSSRFSNIDGTAAELAPGIFPGDPLIPPFISFGQTKNHRFNEESVV